MSRQLESEPVDAGIVEVPGGRVVGWTAWGDPSGAPVLVQPHTGVSGSRLLAEDERPLREAGLRVIRISRSGLGRSTPNPRKSVLTEADDMARVAASLDIYRDIQVLAECGGAGVGLAFAAGWPDRIARLVVLSGAAPVRSIPGKGLPKFLAGLRTVSRFRFLLRAAARAQARAFMKDPEVSMDRAYEVLPDPDRTFAADPKRRAFGLDEAVAFYDSPEAVLGEWALFADPWRIDWSAIAAPVVISHGALDQTMPVSMAHWLNKQLPNAELRVDPDRGHFLASQRIAELLAMPPHTK